MSSQYAASLPPYTYRGARAMVILHEAHMRSFLTVWEEAKKSNLGLPETKDPDYASLDTLLRHVLGAAGGYLRWMCEMLELPDPEIETRPEVEEIAAGAGSYLDHVMDRWKAPLARVPEKRFEDVEYKARWGTLFSIDAMMEHAVMHPIRHEFQLRELMG
jgi:hypothetical protein